MNLRMTIIGLGILALPLLAAAGCSPGVPAGESTVHIKGKLTIGGKPLTIPPAFAQQPGMRPMVNFIRAESGGGSGTDVPEGPAGVSVTGITGTDGTFELDVPTGKYNVSVQFPYAAPEEKAIVEKYGQRGTPIEREVTADGQEIVIDLNNPSGS